MRTLQIVVRPSLLACAIVDGESVGEVHKCEWARNAPAHVRGAETVRLVRRLIEEEKPAAVGFRTTRYPYIGKKEGTKFEHLARTEPVNFLIRWQAERADIPVTEIRVTEAEAGGDLESILSVMARKTPLLLRCPGDDLPDDELAGADEVDEPPPVAEPAPRPERPSLKMVCFGDHGFPCVEVIRPDPDWVYVDTGDDETSYYEARYEGREGVAPPSTTHFFLNGSARSDGGALETVEDRLKFLKSVW